MMTATCVQDATLEECMPDELPLHATFDTVASLYDEVRPGYPDSIINAIVERSRLLSIVAREYTLIVGNAAQFVCGNAAQLPSSAMLHNAPWPPYLLPTRLLAPPHLLSRQLLRSSRPPRRRHLATAADVDLAHVPRHPPVCHPISAA